MLIQALAQCRLRGHVAHTQRLVEELVVAKRGDRLKIALAQALQGDIAGENIAMLHRVRAQCADSGRGRRQVGLVIERPTNEPKAGLRGSAADCSMMNWRMGSPGG